MNEYQREQLETYVETHRRLTALPPSQTRKIRTMISHYLAFRREVDAFQAEYFSDICTRNCYQSHLSACCSRDGIITFFADMVINALLSRDEETEALTIALRKSGKDFKCVYLGKKGCLWRLKPIVCEMFLCDQAEKEVFAEKPEAGKRWEELNRQRKSYTWPDRPVLFDALEEYFLEKGYSSPLMYLHNSPGLLRVKQCSQS